MWDNIGYEQELRSRGFDENFKHEKFYRYMYDGRLINNNIKKYVSKIINIYYETDDDINQDEKLQLFFEQCSGEDYGNIEGFPKVPGSKETVIDVLSRIIWH